MITRFSIRNFKRLGDVTLELGSAAVLIGANNSGKTTALQALALWDIGWRRWAEKRDRSSAKDRPGVTINRRDLFAIPVPSAKLLWADLHTQVGSRAEGKPKTDPVCITLTAEGDFRGRPWRCALDFYYANEESFYCRLRDGDDGRVPEGARQHTVVFLPPMSGLAEREYRKEQGEISVLIGEGQTARVLRNLCWQLHSRPDSVAWAALCRHVTDLFQVQLDDPVYIPERSELRLTYRERGGPRLDLSSSGRGCQQVILLLSFLLANPGSVLLLDEPDAHLESLRQRDVYNLVTEVAASNGSQVIAASHSGIVLQEAAERDVVIAFVGAPHRIDVRKGGTAQVRKALESIPVADYYLAERKGWMLYLEGSTDLAILRRLAARLRHPASALLNDSVPVHYLGSNQPQDARNHFYGLREAKPDLLGFALFDRLDRDLQVGTPLTERMWSRREIENYLVTPKSLAAFVVQGLRADNLFDRAEARDRLAALDASIDELVAALRITGRDDPWGPDLKVTDDFLDPLFRNYFQRLNLPQRIFKNDYHGLADAIALEEIDPEVGRHLDALWRAVGGIVPA